MIETHYDPETDAFAVHFAPKGAYVESEEVAPGVVLDFDAEGTVIGIEVINVRRRTVARSGKHSGPLAERTAAE